MSKEVFICYETTTGLIYAKHLKEALGRVNRSAFVAKEDIKKGEAWQEVIDEAIRSCKYFIVIITIPASKSGDVKREITLAQRFNKTIIPCKHEKVDRSQLSELPVRSEIQQIEFEDKDELAHEVIYEILKRKKHEVIFKVPPSADIYVNGCKI